MQYKHTKNPTIVDFFRLNVKKLTVVIYYTRHVKKNDSTFQS